MEVVQANVVNIAFQMRDTKPENGSEHRNVGRSCWAKEGILGPEEIG